MESCKNNSTERVHRSDYLGSTSELFFPDEDGADIFYSYTTCNSTGVDWETYKTEQAGIHSVDKVLGGITIVSTPIYAITPMVYKRGTDGEILDKRAPEYKIDSVPFEGMYIEYARELMSITNGDIAMINYTHRSNSADVNHPDSPGTATVQDIADGLIDMAIGPFWITGERLKMTPFTVPLGMCFCCNNTT